METSDIIVYGVTVGAFVVGYLVVGFVIKKLKALNDRPPLNEELWREQEKAEAARRDMAAGDASIKSEEKIPDKQESSPPKEPNSH